MSTTEEVTFEAPAKKKAKKAKKAKKRKPPRADAVTQPKTAEAFPGLTRTACADACNEKGCVISGKIYCAHPTKGGLQAGEMSDRTALKRLQSARDQINVRVDPDRFK